MQPNAGPALMFLSLAMAAQVNAICAGNFSVGITYLIGLGMGLNQWLVYDQNCQRTDGLVSSNNLCLEGIFGCGGDPMFLNEYTNTDTGTKWNCNVDKKSETCEDNVIAVCCGPDVVFAS